MSRARAEVALTGFGLLTAYGRGLAPYWDGLVSGRGALGGGRWPVGEAYSGEPVGEVPGMDRAGVSRKQMLAQAALADALRGAGLAAVPDGSLLVVVGQAPAVAAGAPPEAAELVAPPLPAVRGAALLGGAPVHLSHACASGAFAVALAREVLLAGAARTAVVLGASALNPLEYASMQAVRAVSATGARPFDRTRAGISVGEGAGAVVLERRDAALARGRRARILLGSAVCRVAGARPAASDDEVVADCVRQACADAAAGGYGSGNRGDGGHDGGSGHRHGQGLRLDYVHAHATGTQQGDAAELRALETLAAELGLRGVPVSSHKGAVGHLLHASCFPALAAGALALRERTAPPTPGLTDPEPVDRLRLPTAPTPLPGARSVLLTSFGFGGNNAALTLHRAD